MKNTYENFTEIEIIKCQKEFGTLLVDIETNLTCNANCTYCFRNNSEANKTLVVDFKTLIKRIIKIKDAGTKTINIIGGGEPTIYRNGQKNIIDIIKEIKRNKMNVEMFTNGLVFGDDKLCKKIIGINSDEFAEKLYELGVVLFFKVHSLSPKKYDEIIGVDGAYKKMAIGLEKLIELDGKRKKSFLVVQCTITKQNYKEIEELWKFANERKLETSFELARCEGSAKKNNVTIETKQAEIIFKKIKKIDARNNKIWEPIPPYIGYSCDLNRYAIYVDIEGQIYNCECRAINIGNIDKITSIKNQIKQSKEIIKMRELQRYIKGKCSNCQLIAERKCYGGCRGSAWQATGDVFSEDPICWISNSDR